MHLKINLKQKKKKESLVSKSDEFLKQWMENWILVSKKDDFLKQEWGKWICLSKKNGNRIVKRVR